MMTAALIVLDGALRAELKGALQELGVPIVFGLDPTARADQLRSLRPRVVFLEPDPRTPVREAIAVVKDHAPGCSVVVAQRVAQAEFVLDCFRAGASEYVYSPVRAHLASSLARLISQAPRQGSCQGRSIGFLSAKGGCGATTVAWHVARSLRAMRDEETLLADFDMAAGMIGFLTGGKAAYSVADAMTNTHRLDGSYWRGLVQPWEGVDVIAAPPPPVATESFSGSQIREVLRFARSHYQWSVVDLGRGVDRFVMESAAALDELFVVSTVDVPALSGAMTLARVLQAAGAESRVRLLLNRCTKDQDVSVREIERRVGMPLAAQIPDAGSDAYESWLEKRPVASRSRLGTEFDSIARRISGIGDAAAPSKSSWLSTLASRPAKHRPLPRAAEAAL